MPAIAAMPGAGRGSTTPVAVEHFRVLQEAQQADSLADLAAENPLRGRVNLLNWDGKGTPEGIFPGGHAGEDHKEPSR